MFNYTDYTGNQAIIYDEATRKTIAETTILEFNKMSQTIIVSSSDFKTEYNSRVSVLILGENGIYEYQGTIRAMGGYGNLGIALYSGKPKEDRKYVRYTVHAPAYIEHVVIGNKLVSTQTRYQVVVVNLSKEGILIRGNISILNIGTKFEIRLRIANEDVLLNATVVRSERTKDGFLEYGCQLNYQY